MQKVNYQKDWLKFILGWGTCLGFRFIPFRPPNFEPVLTTTMPFAKRYGALSSFIFSAASILFYDVLTQKVGIWTLITAFIYGGLGVGAYIFFKNRKSKPLNYLKYSLIGTLAYDALTGLTIGPLMYGMPFKEAFTGQIPFTLWHLAGNTVMALLVSPALYRWVLKNENLDWEVISAKLAKAA